MGNARWSDVDWAVHSAAVVHKPMDEIFTAHSLDPSLDPKNIKHREAVDSPANPKTTPIILAADDTGSMGVLADQIIKTGLGKIMGQLYERRPVTDPQILCMAVGDSTCDSAPLQVTQFEASIVLAEQVKKMYIERHGGGNSGESYPLAWFFAAYKTKCDAIRKRHRKGYLFTIGDEQPLLVIREHEIERVFGTKPQGDMDVKVLLDHAKKDWEIFHLIVKPVPAQPVVKTWQTLLGPRAIEVENIDTLPETIVSIIQVNEGASVGDVCDSWTDGATCAAVKKAIRFMDLGA